MLRQRIRGARLHVGQRTHLERQPRSFRTFLQFVGFVDANAVADAFGSQHIERFPNAFGSSRFSRVNGPAQPFAFRQRERFGMRRPDVSRLVTSEIERANLVAIVHRQLGDLEAALSRLVPQAAHNQPSLHPGLLLALLQSFMDRVENFLHCQPIAQMKLRREPNLTINRPVGRQVLDNFARDPNEMIAMLHDFQRQIDANKIVGQIDAAFRSDQRRFQRRRQREPNLAPEFATVDTRTDASR